MYPLIIYPLAPSVKDWNLLVFHVDLRGNPTIKKGPLIRTSLHPVQLATTNTTGRHDEVVPIEVVKPLFGPHHRRPVIEVLCLGIRDTFLRPRLLKFNIISLAVATRHQTKELTWYRPMLKSNGVISRRAAARREALL